MGSLAKISKIFTDAGVSPKRALAAILHLLLLVSESKWAERFIDGKGSEGVAMPEDLRKIVNAIKKAGGLELIRDLLDDDDDSDVAKQPLGKK